MTTDAEVLDASHVCTKCEKQKRPDDQRYVAFGRDLSTGLAQYWCRQCWLQHNPWRKT